MGDATIIHWLTGHLIVVFVVFWCMQNIIGFLPSPKSTDPVWRKVILGALHSLSANSSRLIVTLLPDSWLAKFLKNGSNPGPNPNNQGGTP